MNYLISPFIALGTLLIIFSTIIINNSETKKFNSISNKAFIKKIDDEINPLCIKNKSLDNSLDKSTYIENISIDIPNSRGWKKNILEAYISPNQKITSKYKKRFNAQINWNQKNGYTC